MNDGMFYIILSIPHNTVIDLNNVMFNYEAWKCNILQPKLGPLVIVFFLDKGSNLSCDDQFLRHRFFDGLVIF